MAECECGCGQETDLISKTDKAQGRIKGQPNRFVRGHTPERRDDKGPAYKGGKKSHKGYVYVLVQPDHPYFSMARPSSYSSYYISEHRLMMAEHIGRALWDEEVVHHHNGVTDDNRIENLGLFHNQSAHMSYHNKLRKENKNV